MWKHRRKTHGTLRALAIAFACVGPLTGCIGQTVSSAVTGGGAGTTSIRTIAFADAPAYDIGTVASGTTALVRLSISSTGTGDATITSNTNSNANFAFNGGSFPGTGGTCTQPIQGNCSIAILFTAPANGIYTDVVTIGYDTGDGAAATSVTLTANVITAASLTINGAVTYAYGNKTIGTSNDATLTVANLGGLDANSMSFSGLSAPMTYKGGSYPGTGGTCGTSLTTLTTCTIVVSYAPTASVTTNELFAVSYYNGSSTVSSNVSITGTGQTPASLSFTAPAANPYDYGNVTIGAPGVDLTVTVSNSGGQSATALSTSGLSAPMNYKGGTYPGTGGTCGATLAASSTCNIIVTYTPTAAVVTNETLTVSYTNGLGTFSITKGLTGTGLTPASLAISSGPTYDYGSRAIGTTTGTTFTVTNSGGSTATAFSGSALAAPFAYAGGAYPGTAGTCGATLAAAATCTVVVNFAPTAAVVSNATLTLPYNSGASVTSATRPITGTGLTVATLSLNGGANYGFGSKNVGTSTDATLTVANTGGSSATAMVFSGLSAPVTFKDGTFPGTGGTCGATLAPAASCTVVVTYAPVAAGATSKTLLIGYNNGNIATSTSQLVTGTGVALASIAITNPVADPFDFGAVTIGAPGVDQTFTLSNSGGQAATSLTATGLAAPFNFKGGAYPGTGGTCAASLSNGSTCTIVATFLPTTPGVDSDSLVISYNDGSGATINLSRGVTGTGGNAADLQISDSASYDFGSRTVTTTTNHTFTITNAGGSTATSIVATALSAPYTYKGGTYPGTGGSCATTLGAGATCTIIVSFTPAATGAFTDTLTLTFDDGVSTGITTSRPLTGTGGSVANLSISDGATYSYGSIVKGYTVTKTFTVTNLGGVAATAMSGAALAAPYSYLGGAYPGTGGTCSTSLGAAGTCTVLVKYSPTSAVTSNATLTLNYNDSTAATTSTRAITGSGATISKIAGGTGHTCAMYSTGAVKCWGSGSFGQLGNGSTSSSTTPVSVIGITTATDIAVGANHSCAMLSNGRVYCWGADNSGQQGDNASLTNNTSPAQVGLYTDFTQISAGGDTTCGRRSGGTIVCWGNDLEGTVGDDVAYLSQATPVAVSGLTSMTDVSVGRGHACGRRSDNTFRCWGANTNGQLGNGTTTTSGIPVTPTPGTSTASSAGGDVSCSLNSGGTVKCWGADDMGQLGDNVALAQKTSPTTVTGLANVTSIKMGLKHGCALTSTSSIVCWGSDVSGQIGDNASYTNQSTPAAVTGMASVSNIGVGENHSCGVLSSGLVYCWGQGTANQLGDGGSTNQPTPVLVQGL